jgi:uncharacterized zinc-type alcohol dehydrogenase-like protein
MTQVHGYGVRDAKSRMERLSVDVADPADGELEVEVLFCGVCHSDIHQVKNEWHNSVYPCVPGHEVVGRVRRAGANVTRFVEGDVVGIGCMIDSCGTCGPCRAGEQNYCEGPNSWLATYNGPMVPRATAPDGGNMYGRDNTFGGYAERLVVREEFALKIPPALKPEHAAPLLCAGATTWSPLRQANVGPGSRVGVVGLGGLGHVAVKLARALGAEVTVFTHTPEKLAEAKEIGANDAVLESDAKGLERLVRRFDLILSTVPQKHDLGPFVPCLKHDGRLIVVGALEPLPPVDNMALALGRRTVGGSLIGSLAETQEVLDFCAEHGIAPEIQMIRADELNDAFDQVERGEVRFRYVIDGRSIGVAGTA